MGMAGLGSESIEAISQATSNNDGWSDFRLAREDAGGLLARLEILQEAGEVVLCLATSNLLQVSRSLRAEFNFREKAQLGSTSMT